MSIKLMSQVWECEFDHSEQIVMLAMADHADDQGRRVFPSLGRIAWKTGYSKNQVRRVVHRLETDGVLVLVRKESQHRAREYRIDLSAATLKPEFRDTKMGGLDPSPTILKSSPTISTPRATIAMVPESSIEPSREPPLTAGSAPAGQPLPPVEDDPWARTPALQINVPQGGNNSQKAQFVERCDQCSATMTQASDACPECGRPVEWIGSPLAAKRVKRQKVQIVDQQAAARRAAEAKLSEPVRFVLNCARSSPASSQTTYNKGQADALQALVDAYGPMIVKDKANEFKANGEQGMGLIKHLISFMQQYNPNAGNKGRQSEIVTIPAYVAPKETNEPVDYGEPLADFDD